jgi:hypothetical protein
MPFGKEGSKRGINGLTSCRRPLGAIDVPQGHGWAPATPNRRNLLAGETGGGVPRLCQSQSASAAPPPAALAGASATGMGPAGNLVSDNGVERAGMDTHV